MSDTAQENVQDEQERDFFEKEPSCAERAEMRKASKTPSEWLQLLCKDWAEENVKIMNEIDSKFLNYKRYLKGQLSSQLLCRLSMDASASVETTVSTASSDKSTRRSFWHVLGVEDDFDQHYIIAQVEKFCQIYNIRGVGASAMAFNPLIDEEGNNLLSSLPATQGTTAAEIAMTGFPLAALPAGWDVDAAQAAAAVAAAAAAQAVADTSVTTTKAGKRQATTDIAKANRKLKDAEKALDEERRKLLKREKYRLAVENKIQKAKEREEMATKKSAEKAAREAERTEKRKKKLEMRMAREKLVQERKEEALRRAAELVESNRVPIEITRGAGVAEKASSSTPSPSKKANFSVKKGRSRIVVSTANDLHQIVTHSNNLWAKYSAIAKEHNQKVNWITVATELGIHVKVREKYARMYNRGRERGFDFEANGDFKIKDYPHIFLEPLQSEGEKKASLGEPSSIATDASPASEEQNDEHTTVIEKLEGTQNKSVKEEEQMAEADPLEGEDSRDKNVKEEEQMAGADPLKGEDSRDTNEVEENENENENANEDDQAVECVTVTKTVTV